MREQIREHLRGVIGLLAGFVLASAAVALADAPGWSRVLAAALALVSLSAVVAWLQLPWAEWTARRARRLVLATVPMVAAGLVLLLGVLVSRGEASVVLTDPATLILLDVSDGMLKPLQEGAAKFAEATRELRRHVRDLGNDQLGLATFGIPACDVDETIEERVPIAHDRAERIREEAEGLRPAGRANLVSAARNAIGLLNDFDDERRRLLVITAGLDDCGGDLAELLEESEIKDVAVQWEVVGLGLSPAEKAQVQALPDVRVHLADTSAELNGILGTALFEEPIREELDSALEYVQTDIREPLNAAIGAINVRPSDAPIARANLGQLQELAQDGQERFDDFATEDERSVFVPIKSLLQEQFELLQEAAAAVEEVVEFDQGHRGDLRDSEIEERNVLVRRLNMPVDSYNENLPRLEERVEQALDELFGGR